ncbi:hypothetical protein CCMA1212_003612 [Trichoderma ghanense]|uniref:Uncharacterized protein n=1 Tax=Trichoderma ghanense TaxID=65468 RepID=A0ABY2H732_9HYPO
MQQPEPRNSRSRRWKTVGEGIHSTYAGGGRGQRARQAHQWPKAADQREDNESEGCLVGCFRRCLFESCVRRVNCEAPEEALLRCARDGVGDESESGSAPPMRELGNERRTDKDAAPSRK